MGHAVDPEFLGFIIPTDDKNNASRFIWVSYYNDGHFYDTDLMEMVSFYNKQSHQLIFSKLVDGYDGKNMPTKLLVNGGFIFGVTGFIRLITLGNSEDNKQDINQIIHAITFNEGKRHEDFIPIMDNIAYNHYMDYRGSLGILKGGKGYIARFTHRTPSLLEGMILILFISILQLTDFHTRKK